LESLTRAYQIGQQEYKGMSMQLYENYLRAQGLIGEELYDLSQAYVEHSESFIDYIQSGNLSQHMMDTMLMLGIFERTPMINSQTGEQLRDMEGNFMYNEPIFRGQNLRNIMFDLETGEMTIEGRMLMNMLQANQGINPETGERLLSYDEWLFDQRKYRDSRIDANTMRTIMGIESEHGVQYSETDWLRASDVYRRNTVEQLQKEFEAQRLTNTAAYSAIQNPNFNNDKIKKR
jgi:hypothetical protein